MQGELHLSFVALYREVGEPMNLVIGFAPFIIFAVLTRLSVDLALWLAFAAAFVVTMRDFVERPSLRLLDGGSLALFAALALWRGFIQPSLPLAGVRLIADMGLLLIVAGSLVLRRPFTLQYASAESEGMRWPDALFLRTNYVISIVWGLAFAAMAAADGAATFNPRMPIDYAVGTGLVALAFATTFTLRYPGHAQKANRSGA